MAVSKKKGAARDPKRRAAVAKEVSKKPEGSFSFPVGNGFWQCRSKHGPAYLYEGEEGAAQLLAEADAYIKWCIENPFMEGKLVTFQGYGRVEEVPKMRVATLRGFCLYLGIHTTTLADWKKRPDLCSVILVIEEMIYEYKFSGAAADLLNANIISRDLGLADKTELTGPGGGPVQSITGEMSAKEAADLYAATREKK